MAGFEVGEGEADAALHHADLGDGLAQAVGIHAGGGGIAAGEAELRDLRPVVDAGLETVEASDLGLALRALRGGGGEAGVPELLFQIEELGAPREQRIGREAGLAGGGESGDGLGAVAGDPGLDGIEVLAGEAGLALQCGEPELGDVGPRGDHVELRLLGFHPDVLAADFLGGDARGDAFRFDRAFGGGAGFRVGGAFGVYEGRSRAENALRSRNRPFG